LKKLIQGVPAVGLLLLTTAHLFVPITAMEKARNIGHGIAGRLSVCFVRMFGFWETTSLGLNVNYCGTEKVLCTIFWSGGQTFRPQTTENLEPPGAAAAQGKVCLHC
jgi:hypothetical protein